jgi:RNA polymerase sigma-70 factor (ECF subfamily)
MVLSVGARRGPGTGRRGRGGKNRERTEPFARDVHYPDDDFTRWAVPMAEIIPLHARRSASAPQAAGGAGPSSPPVAPAAPVSSDVALTERDDDDLMLLARGGVAGAFDALVRRHQRKVLRIAAKYVGNTATATDVAQNTFIEVYRALPHYRASGKFSSWLYRLVLNQCRMNRRASARQDERLRALAAVAGEEIHGRSAESILARERRHEVESALGQLSDKLREVVVLRFASELSYEEISDVLDIPVGTVKSRLFAGLDKLRQHLEKDEP